MGELVVDGMAHMAIFEIKSLFMNVPIEETIEICAQELYNSDLEPIHLTEGSFRKLMYKVTSGVEIGHDDFITSKSMAFRWARQGDQSL